MGIASVAVARSTAVAAIIGYKALHDYVQSRDEMLVRRYTAFVGRVTALFTGAFAIEMILLSLEGWIARLPATSP